MQNEFVILFAILAVATSMRIQGVSVTGRLLCGNATSVGTKVRTVDLDTGILFFSSPLLVLRGSKKLKKNNVR